MFHALVNRLSHIARCNSAIMNRSLQALKRLCMDAQPGRYPRQG